jgi:hypothetical protein
MPRGEFVKSILKTCTPRPDILAGTFNPEIFTASLSQVIDSFLNQKMATLENFQGTRGVLRVLALAVRSLWERRQAIPMIHTCHLTLRDARIVNEVISRTGGGRMRLLLQDVPPEDMKRLGELFEILGDLVSPVEQTQGRLWITDPQDDCPLVQALKKD